ncbi:hypothetical protein ACFL3C_04630 [Patescibacteria group bacterium]
MSEQAGEKFEFPELQELTRLSAEFGELHAQQMLKGRDRISNAQREENLTRMDELKQAYIYLIKEALVDSPDQAREIVETASELWQWELLYGEGDFRSEIFGTLLKQRIAEGLYMPQEHESYIHTDYPRALEFIERRMRIIGSLIEAGSSEFEPYMEFLRESRCKLKVRDMTFWIGNEKHEKHNMETLGGSMNKNEFWNDLAVYVAQKTPAEIGGIDRVVGENRITSSYPGDPERTYDSIRSGNQIVHEVEAEAYKYDLYTMLFIASLERDLEIGTGQSLHYDRLGMFSRSRRTREARDHAQRTYRPSIQQQNQAVAEKVREVIDTNGAALIPEPSDDFAERIETIMNLYPKYEYGDVESILPKEAIIVDDEVQLCTKEDWQPFPEYTDADYQECELGDSSDITAYEDSRTDWDSTGPLSLRLRD